MHWGRVSSPRQHCEKVQVFCKPHLVRSQGSPGLDSEATCRSLLSGTGAGCFLVLTKSNARHRGQIQGGRNSHDVDGVTTMALYEESRTGSTPADPPPSLVPTHARSVVDVLLAMADEYAATRRWDAELFQALAGTPALSSASRPDSDAAHAEAHLHLVAREIGRLLTSFPCVVFTGLVEGITEAMEAACGGGGRRSGKFVRCRAGSPASAADRCCQAWPENQSHYPTAAIRYGLSHEAECPCRWLP